MKKLLLAIGVLPLAVSAQQFHSAVVNKMSDAPAKLKPGSVYQSENISPVRLGGNMYHARPNNQSASEMLPATQIGVTYYDLMTNSAMPRRVILYPGGKVSVVWTSSNDQGDNNFPNRGTGYNHFDGTSWIGQNDTKFEPERAGWPNLVTYNDGGVDKEVDVSHYAAGGTGESGGTFWMMNTGIGKSDFSTFLTKDKPNGPLWPRTAITGTKLHVIAVYQTNSTDNSTDVIKAGVRTPIVYYRYDLSTGKMEADGITLPGYDSTRYGNSNADEYSIDARGNTVAIVIGGMNNDVALYKSTDAGENWTKTIIQEFVHAPFDPARKDHPTLGDHQFLDTAETNDGAVHVILDKDGNAHVFWPKMRILNEDESDAGFSYFPGTNGIEYWNEKTKTIKEIAGMVDMDGDGQLNVRAGTTSTSNGSYTSALATFPMASIDPDGNIFMVYSAPNEMDVTADEEVNYRDLYLVYSKDGGETWLPQVGEVTTPMQLTGDPALEDVFPTMSRDADNSLHLVWMRDEQPGIFLVNQIEIVNNAIMYADINIQDIFDGTVGIQAHKAPVFTIGDVYPNPASNMVNIPVSMKNSAAISVKVVDVMGKTVTVENNTMLPAGQNLLSLGLEKLTSGIYFCQVTANGQTVTKKIVVQ